MEQVYLKARQHYVDQYDLFTIKRCLEVVEMYQEVYERCLKEPKLKNVSEEEKRRGVNQMLHWRLFALKASEYQRKEETIEQWMGDDRREQEKYDNTSEPSNVRCASCGAAMHVTFKDLQNHTDEPLRMLFFFDCTACKKRRAVYEDGEEWEHKEYCSKCEKEVETTRTRKGQVITWTKKCASCGHSESDSYDLKERSEKSGGGVDEALLEK